MFQLFIFEWTQHFEILDWFVFLTSGLALFLAIPILFANLLQSAYQLIDAFWV